MTTLALWQLKTERRETLLYRLTLSAARADVTFEHIPQTYRHLILDVTGANTNATAASAHAYVNFNGDTNIANYCFMEQRGQNDGPVADAIEALVALGCIIGFTGTAANPTIQNMARAVLSNYTSGFHKLVMCDESALVPSTGFDAVVTMTGWWLSTAAVHTVRFFPQAGNWAASTTFSIWGVP